MRRVLAVLLAVCCLVLGAGALVSAATAADEPTETPTETPTEPTEGPTEGPFAVSDAVFRWGVNDETNNRAFAPGTFNFLSAGKAPDPGRGGQVIDAQGRWPTTGAVAWQPISGAVRIEKVTTSGVRLADLAGLKTAADDTTTLPGATSGVFSNHQVVISGGTGKVDPTQGTAEIAWQGSFTVFFYSGMTFFSLSDPVLRVSGGRATITATASGFASSMEDQTKWQPVAPRQVTIADLPAVGLPELSAARGFSATPAYLGVTAAGFPQVPGAFHGAFPQDFLEFVDAAGSAAYWYSSGGASDAYKVPKPVSISWDAKTAIQPEPPAAVPVTTGKQPKNKPGKKPPAASPGTSTATVDQPAGPALPAQPAQPGVPVAAPATAAVAPAGYQPPVAYALASAPTSPTPADRPTGPGRAWEWVLGSLLLLGAVGITLSAPVMNRLKGTR